VAEWLKAHAWRACSGRKVTPGFEPLPLRQSLSESFRREPTGFLALVEGDSNYYQSERGFWEMILLIIAGLYALIAGRITITKGLRLVGKNARIYGGVLIAISIPYLIFASILLSIILPANVLSNDYAKPIINLILLVIIAVGLAIPFREK
jgi:hypothetical protein